MTSPTCASTRSSPTVRIADPHGRRFSVPGNPSSRIGGAAERQRQLGNPSGGGSGGSGPVAPFGGLRRAERERIPRPAGRLSRPRMRSASNGSTLRAGVSEQRAAARSSAAGAGAGESAAASAAQQPSASHRDAPRSSRRILASRHVREPCRRASSILAPVCYDSPCSRSSPPSIQSQLSSHRRHSRQIRVDPIPRQATRAARRASDDRARVSARRARRAACRACWWRPTTNASPTPFDAFGGEAVMTQRDASDRHRSAGRSRRRARLRHHDQRAGRRAAGRAGDDRAGDRAVCRRRAPADDFAATRPSSPVE